MSLETERWRAVENRVYCSGGWLVCECPRPQDALLIVQAVNTQTLLAQALEPFIKMLAKFPSRPRPICRPEYWEEVVYEKQGVRLTVGDFAALAGLLYVDRSSPVTEQDMATALRLQALLEKRRAEGPV